MPKKVKALPSFKNSDEEQKFWETHSVADYFDWDEAVVNPVMPSLKPSTTSISLRMPTNLLEQIKVDANRRDVPYQTLIKMKLFEIFDSNGTKYGK